MFLVFFSVAIMLNINNQFHYFSNNRSVVELESFLTSPKVPPFPYDGDHSLLPEQDVSVVDQNLKIPCTIAVR